MYTFKVIDNPFEWREILQEFKNKDCYYAFEYGNLFAKIENGQLFAAYFKSNETIVFYPFIKRKVPYIKDELFDIVTPYGYGGPLVQGIKEINVFYKLFSSYCALNKIITETIRFHPLYRNHLLLDGQMDIEYIRQTTLVDLSSSLEVIQDHYTSMNKRNIKRAKKNNLTCFAADKTEGNIRRFIELYKETMDRNSASGYYYFDENYFHKQMKDTETYKNFLLFTKKDSEIIAGVIVMVGSKFSHYHLGASKTNYLDLKPNNLLFDFMIQFCKERGSSVLHLGGGYKENDGLFKYKSSFSNGNNLNYYIGKKVHDPKMYETIVHDLRKQYKIDESYFPIYRGQTKREIHI